MARRKRWLRALLWTFATIPALVVLAIVAIAAVASTSAGTHFALTKGLAFYDDRIPGQVTVARVHGRLTDVVTLEGILVTDASGRPLIECGVARLELAWRALPTRSLVFDRLDLEDLGIHLWPAPASWGDLAPQPAEGSPPKPAPHGDRLGPDLPLRLAATLRLAGANLWQHDGAAATGWVRSANLSGTLDAEGTRAELRIATTSGWATANAIPVVDLRGAILWEDPVVSVSDFGVWSAAGWVSDLEGELDARAKRFHVAAQAAAHVPLDAPAPPVAAVSIFGHGTFEHAAATIEASAPGLADLHLHALARHTEAWEVALGGSAAVRAGAIASDVPSGPKDLVVMGGLSTEESLHGHVALLAPDLSTTATLTTTTTGGTDQAAPQRDDAQAITALLRIPGLSVDGSADLRAWQPHAANVRIDAPSLDSAYAAVRRWWTPPAAVPSEIRGHLAADAACRFASRALEHCSLSVDAGDLVIDGQRIDEVAVAASGTDRNFELDARARRDRDRIALRTGVRRDAANTVVGLEQLEAHIADHQVRLTHPSTIEVSPEAIVVHDLSVRGEGGRLWLDGRLAQAGPSHAKLRLRGLELALLRRFVPALPVSGTVGAEVVFDGTVRAPDVVASVSVDRLRHEDDPLGRVTASMSYRDSLAVVRLGWHDRTSRVDLMGRIPVDVDLGQRKVEPQLRTRPGAAEVCLTGFELEQLSPWVDLPLRGRVDATIAASGTLSDLEARTEGRVLRLNLSDLPLGTVDWKGDWIDRRVELTTHLSGKTVRKLSAHASVPVPLDPHAKHTVTVELAGADLAQLRAAWPESNFEGIVDADAHVTLEESSVSAEIVARAHGLELGSAEIGTAELATNVTSDHASAELRISGPGLQRANLRGVVPLRFERPFAAPSIAPDVPWSASLTWSSLELRSLSGVREGLELAGDTSGELALSGTPARPTAKLRLDADELAVRGARIGDLELDAEYSEARARVDLHQRERLSSLDLSADIPIRIDPVTPAFAWGRDEEHHLTLVAKALDEAILAPIFEVPRSWNPRISAHVEVHGTPEALRGRATANASFSAEDRIPTPVAILLALDEDEQHAKILVSGNGPEPLEIEARTRIRISDLIAGKVDFANTELEAHARARGFPLRAFAPLAPDHVHDPDGLLHLNADARGTFVAPHLRGQVSLDGAEVTVVALNQRLRNIDLHARFDGPDVTLERLSMASGRGTAQAKGALHLARGETHGALELETKELPVVRPGLPLLRVDGKVGVEFDGRGERSEVEVEARNVFIDVLEYKLLENPTPIPPLDGVRLPSMSVAPAGGSKAEKEPWLPTDVRARVRIADPVLVRGAQTEMRWDGAITVERGHTGKARASGEFEAQGGYFELLNHEFELAEGSIQLPEEGDVDPYLRVTADTEIASYVVSVKITGRASRPELALSSNPPLPEDQVFALLVTGRPDAGAGEDTDVAAKAASLLAQFQNSTLQRQLRDQLGIDRVGVGFGDSVEEPILTAGKRINRKLYVETRYHVNADVETENRAEARVEYRFFPPEWSLETIFGTEGIGELGVWWQRSFGGPSSRRSSSTANAPEP